MQLQIKLLEREPFAVQASSDVTIDSIKQTINDYLQVPVDEQRLVFQGQILKDDKKVKNYPGLKNNSKVHLIIVTQKRYPLYNKIYDIVRPHYTEKETQKILSIFMRKMYDSFGKLSLDDLERIAQQSLRKKSADDEFSSDGRNLL